jgi:hypothetical protein
LRRTRDSHCRARSGAADHMVTWRTRRRDPASTGVVHLPWKARDLCPCGDSDRPYGDCCGRVPRSPYKQIAQFRPPGAATGYRHPRCYMRWTRNCSDTISGEHFISKDVAQGLRKRGRSSRTPFSKGETPGKPSPGVPCTARGRKPRATRHGGSTRAGLVHLFRRVAVEGAKGSLDVIAGNLDDASVRLG